MFFLWSYIPVILRTSVGCLHRLTRALWCTIKCCVARRISAISSCKCCTYFRICGLYSYIPQYVFWRTYVHTILCYLFPVLEIVRMWSVLAFLPTYVSASVLYCIRCHRGVGGLLHLLQPFQRTKSHLTVMYIVSSVEYGAWLYEKYRQRNEVNGVVYVPSLTWLPCTMYLPLY